MKITPINNIKKLFGITLAAGTIVYAPTLASNSTKNILPHDTFISSVEVPPSGTTDSLVLDAAPNPVVFVKGQKRNATIVVDLSKNVLYKYDEEGQPEAAYRIASGKPRTPTDPGLRVVSHVEKYPYKSAPVQTKRHKQPLNYGPRAIILQTVDPKTGRRGSTGEFIHGNNNAASIGKYASLGCMRMDNEVIKKLAEQVKKGDLVLITKEGGLVKF